MSDLKKLIACAGEWRGTNRLHDPTTNAPDDSSSTATVTPVLHGKFLRVDYTWAYKGAPQEGSLLLGYEPEADVVTAQWIDTWHMGDKVMACKGAAGSDGSASLRGTYAAPPGPDWGWRTVITPSDGRSLRFVMHNFSPDGQEDVAVEANYTRV